MLAHQLHLVVAVHERRRMCTQSLLEAFQDQGVLADHVTLAANQGAQQSAEIGLRILAPGSHHPQVVVGLAGCHRIVLLEQEVLATDAAEVHVRVDEPVVVGVLVAVALAEVGEPALVGLDRRLGGEAQRTQLRRFAFLQQAQHLGWHRSLACQTAHRGGHHREEGLRMDERNMVVVLHVLHVQLPVVAHLVAAVDQPRIQVRGDLPQGFQESIVELLAQRQRVVRQVDEQQLPHLFQVQLAQADPRPLLGAELVQTGVRNAL